MSITAEQIAQLDEGDIQALHDVPGLTDGDKQLLGAALELKRPKAVPRGAEPSTTVPLTPERKAKVDEQISRSSLPERHGFAGNLWQGVKDQAAGSVSAFTAHGIPLLSPSATAFTENVGELLGTAFPSIRQHMPQPGDAERRIANAPIPELAETAGQAVMPLAGGINEIGQVEKLENIPSSLRGMYDAAHSAADRIAKVGNGAQEPFAEFYQGLAGKAPGGLRTLAAGAGTGIAIGTAEGELRHAPELVDPNTHLLPRSWSEAGQQLVGAASELAPAGAFGALTSAPGALASASQKPNTIVGARAIRYARDRDSGAYKTGDLAGLFPGKEGVSQANELGKSRIGTAERQAKMDFEDQMPALEQPVRTGERRAKEALDADLADTRKTAELRKVTKAAPIEQRLRGKLQQQRSNDAKTGSADAYSAAIDKAETQLGPDGQPKKFPSEGLMESIRGIVGPHARQDTEGSVAKSAPRPTGLLDAQGKPLTEETEGAPGSGEVHTSFGKALQAIEAAANHYLREDSTIRDYRNFLKAVKTQAESGTAEKTFPFKEVVGAVRKHLASLDPELAAATARYRESTTGQSRTQQIVYSKYDPHALGKETVQGKMDVPEVEDGGFEPKQLTPADEEVGRRNLIELSSRNAGDARIPHREELIANGYGDEIKDMKARLDEVDNMTHSTEQKHADAVAQVEADVSRQVLELKRKLRGKLDEPVAEARTAADELNLSKMSQEASRFPGLSKLVHPMLIGSLGLTSHSAPHGASLVGLSANSVAGTIAQPFASRAAYYSPDPGTAQANIPGLMGMVSAADAARERIAKGAPAAARALIDGAREQGNRLKERAKSIISPQK
jgi:hypothetical protein